MAAVYSLLSPVRRSTPQKHWSYSHSFANARLTISHARRTATAHCRGGLRDESAQSPPPGVVPTPSGSWFSIATRCTLSDHDSRRIASPVRHHINPSPPRPPTLKIRFPSWTLLRQTEATQISPQEIFAKREQSFARRSAVADSSTNAKQRRIRSVPNVRESFAFSSPPENDRGQIEAVGQADRRRERRQFVICASPMIGVQRTPGSCRYATAGKVCSLRQRSGQRGRISRRHSPEAVTCPGR